MVLDMSHIIQQNLCMFCLVFCLLGQILIMKKVLVV